MTCPCKDCSERITGGKESCHASCEKYKSWRAYYETEEQKKKAARDEYYKMSDYYREKNDRIYHIRKMQTEKGRRRKK